MCNFVAADKTNRGLSAETKFHIQKYDGLENIEKPSRTSEVTLGESGIKPNELYAMTKSEF
jgi:hypothetical protein